MAKVAKKVVKRRRDKKNIEKGFDLVVQQNREYLKRG